MPRAQQQIEGLEADVEAARQSVYMSLNSVMAVRHVLEHTAAQHERVGETLGKLDVEDDDLRRERERVDADRTAALEALSRAQDGARDDPARSTPRESRSWPARAAEHEGRAREVRTREQELAARRGPAGVARGARHQPRRLRRRRPHGAGAGQRPRRPAGRGGRLPGRRSPLRARGRSLPRRPARARHRRAPRSGGRRSVARA